MQRSKDVDLKTVILRKGLEASLKLKPSVWEGKGLLGCHIVPMR